MRFSTILCFSVAALAFTHVTCQPAAATCSIPHNLTNGTAADASQVMGNFSALQNCIDDQVPAGSTNAVQYNSGFGSFAGVGPLTDGQLLIGSTGAAPQAATLTPGTGISITNTSGTITIATTGSGAGGGINPYSAKVPDLSQWANVGTSLTTGQASVTSGHTQALRLFSNAGLGTATFNVQPITIGAPTPPYRVAAAFTMESYPESVTSAGIGFYSGGAMVYMRVLWASSGPMLKVTTLSSPTVGVADLSTNNLTNVFKSVDGSRVSHDPIWLGLRDDGTNVYYEVSFDNGLTFHTIWTEVKSSGYLANYATLMFAISPGFSSGTDKSVSGTLLCWDPNGLNRTLTSIYDN